MSRKNQEYVRKYTVSGDLTNLIEKDYDTFIQMDLRRNWC